MTISSLDIALSGLRAAQQSLDVTSNNIANASTPGYTRKVLPQEAIFAGEQPLGVKIGEITRKVDLSLLSDMFKQRAVSEGLTTRESYLEQIQIFHGPSENEQAISNEISLLRELFADLSTTPDSAALLGEAVGQARQTAAKINDFADLLTQMRNDAQNDISEAVAEVNAALDTIAEANRQIGAQSSAGRSTAELEDRRDAAIATVSQYMTVSFFTRSDGIMVVMTGQGHTLADEEARQLQFNPTPVGASSYHPGGGAASLTINDANNTDITNVAGGAIGALFTLRDETLPQYTAQLDELAQKMAERFDQQGLRLFVDSDGTVPASVADPGLVGYVGFAGRMQVNPAVIADPTLLRDGTTGNTLPAGSSELLRRIVDFTFGEFAYEEANGTLDISAGTLFATAGLAQEGQAVGGADITAIDPLDSHPDIAAGSQFSIQVGAGPVNVITINAGDTATDLVNNINAIAGPGTARLNTLGGLVIEGAGDIAVADVSLGAAGIAALGHSFGVTPAQNPSFTLQLGSENPVTVSIAPGDTAATLLATLNAIPNVTAALNGSNGLQITPAAGDITLIDVLGGPLAAMGVTVSGVAHEPFRQANLGPDGSVSTDLLATPTLEQFGREMISLQSEHHSDAKRRAENETVFFNTLEQRFQNDSGVDLDQEVAELIRLQTAYTAAARMITTSEEMFNTLLNSI